MTAVRHIGYTPIIDRRALATPRAAAGVINKARTLNVYLMGAIPYVGMPKGRVSGTVKEHSVPSDVAVARVTHLHRHRDGQRIMSTVSKAATGAYDFRYVDTREKYFVVAFDHTLNYNAVIKSDITPDVI